VLVLEYPVHADEEALRILQLAFLDDPRGPHLVLQLLFSFTSQSLVVFQVSEKLQELIKGDGTAAVDIEDPADLEQLLLSQ